MRVVERGNELETHEKELYFGAFKKVMLAKRFSWQVLTAIIAKTEGCDKKAIAALDYRAQIEDEIRLVCNLVIKQIQDYLLPISSSPESMVFYYEMMADYYRYKCEIEVNEERENVIKLAMDTYDKAAFHADRHLDITNATRLSLYLNYAVFYREILNEVDKALAMNETTFNRAIEKIEDFNEPRYKDTIVIIQLMRDNMTLWNKDQDTIPVDPDKPIEEEKPDKSKKFDKSKKSGSPKNKSGSPKKKSGSPKKK
uniref:14-3-3 zeta n=1 Tax=Dugesia japonica TaxID=6161 RepID=A0A1V0JB97_DUGJA|nr:14-3-3 zeta [Dugesia japonica]